MSHKGGRKSHTAALTEDKEKRPADTPVKEMKKKIAANAEKEKQITEKTVTLPEKSTKNDEKVTDKPHNEKTDNKKAQIAEKVDKHAPTPDKNTQKAVKNVEKTDKNTDKADKITEKDKNTEKDKTNDKSNKNTDKVIDKKVEKPVEKKNEAEKKEESKGDKDKPEKPKQNGATNGDANGTADTVSDPDSSEEDLLVIDDQDEVFPELTYDETSDVDFEEGPPSRSFTRRSQSKEKLLKMNDSLATDRKLRSADSPKRESKKPAEPKKAQDSPKKDKTIDLTEDELEKNDKEGVNNEGVEKTGAGKSQLEMDVVIEVESLEETRAKTRARVSPYTSRLPTAKHDQTTSSMMANYTGNNTTMEMDITETSIIEEPNLDDSSYLRGLRTIRGRSSYKPLKELALKHTFNRSTRSTTSASNTSLTETGRPTGTVVGRKRKPDAEADAEAEDVELAREAPELEPGEPEELLHARRKRMRLFDRFSVPFRGFNTRRAAEIVGINTDLPLTAPVASTSSFDPETLKASASEPIAVPLPPACDRDSKRCAIM